MSPVAEDREIAAEVRAVAIKTIKVTSNIRKHFDEKAQHEMEDSLRKPAGLLHAIIVRDLDDGSFELLAGERRLRAATAIGWKMIAAKVVTCTDEEAREIQAAENLQRKDLTPIEEARAFKMLNGTGPHDVKSLAAKVDKSEAYVYRALRLLELPDPVLDAIEEGKLTPAHGHQLLRAPEKRREGIAKDAIRQRMHAGDLQEAIDRELGHDLSKTAFPKDRPFAGKPACVGCPFNSDNQQDLLGEIVKGRCTGADCFKAKTDAYVVTFVDEQKEKFPGVKFAGVVDRDYDLPVTPGFVKVSASAPVLALAKKDPASFRAVVIKQVDYHNPRPGIVLFARPTKDVKRAAGFPVSSPSTSRGSEAAGERPSRIQAIGELTTAAEQRACWGKIGKLPTVVQMHEALFANGDSDRVCQILQITPDQFKAFDQTQMLKAVFFTYAGFGGNLETIRTGKRADFEKPIVEAAAKVWPKHLSPACKVCGCTPNNGCTMGKKDDYRSCWWVKPGLCSACQAQGKDIAAAKGKKKA